MSPVHLKNPVSRLVDRPLNLPLKILENLGPDLTLRLPSGFSSLHRTGYRRTMFISVTPVYHNTTDSLTVFPITCVDKNFHLVHDYGLPPLAPNRSGRLKPGDKCGPLQHPLHSFVTHDFGHIPGDHVALWV